MISELLYIRRSKTILVTLTAFTIGINAFMMVPDLSVQDQEPDTWYFVLPYVFTCEVDEIPNFGAGIQRNPLKWWINCLSFTLTDNYKLLPGLFGIGIMPLVYFLGYYITNDRFIGFASVLAFTTNPLYTDWATQGTYDQVWAFFFILSLVFLFKSQPVFSMFSMILSITAKSMAVIMLPIYLYTLYHSKKNLTFPIMFAAIIGVTAFVGIGILGINPIGNEVGFYPERWEDALFRNISLFWQVVPILALFVVINRNFISKNHPPNQKLVGIWMLWFFMLNPLVYFFTLQDTYSYRYVPLAAFMSVFYGMTIVQLGNWIIERKITPKIIHT